MALGEYRGPLSCKAFVRYATSRHAIRQIDLMCVSYVAESIRNSVRGMYFSETLPDKLERIMHPVPERTANEIIDDVAARLEAS